jgi:hypothetical protein
MKRRLTALLATAVIASPLAYGDYQLSPEEPRIRDWHNHYDGQ